MFQTTTQKPSLLQALQLASPHGFGGLEVGFLSVDQKKTWSFSRNSTCVTEVSILKSPDSGKYHHIWAEWSVVCFIWVIWKNWPWSRCIRHYKINGAASLGSVARLQKFQNMTFQVWTSKGRGCWQITGSTLTRDPTIVGCGWWMATQGKMLLDQGLPSGACHNLLWWIRSPKNDQTAHANTWGLPMTWVWIDTY